MERTMEHRVRIATWNLERPRPRSWKRLPRQLARMAAVDADIWVLTETRASIAPADGYHPLHTPADPRCPDHDERWVSIWSRWPLQPTDLPPDSRGAISAVADTPDGPLVVYGTVLPWANDKGEHGTARLWQVHYQQIERQAEQWQTLRRSYPGAPLVVAGDFNQDRDGSGWYGTHHGRQLLTDGLDRAGLTCATAEDVVATGKLRTQQLIDHIAVCREWAERNAIEVHCWEPSDTDGTHLSDHPTVAIELRPAPAAIRPTHGSSRGRTATVLGASSPGRGGATPAGSALKGGSRPAGHQARVDSTRP